jgi:LacI family transcriptional regulator
MANLSINVVAKAAGVHRSTVSRAFSQPEAVKAETREHVLRVAQELGYAMSPLAQALRRKTSTFVPLIVPNVTNPFFAELADAMTQAAGDRGYQLVLCVTNGDTVQTGGYLTAMQALYAPFGIVAPSTRVDLDALAQFDFGQRVVVIDRVDEHATVAASSSPSTICVRSGIATLVMSRAFQVRTPPTSGWTPTATWPTVTRSSSTAAPTPKRGSAQRHISPP